MDPKMCVSFFLAVLSLCAASPPEFRSARLMPDSSLRAATDEKMTIFRLPRNIRPKEYNLRVTTDLEDRFTFSGTVTIKVSVEMPTPAIVLNSKQLKITKAAVKNQRGYDIKNTNFTLDEPNEQLHINCPDLAVRKEYTVVVDFEGVLSDDMNGYYRSSYKVKDTKKWLAITQFEATSARRAFPCFDEPGYKTPYTIELNVKPGQTALSNMPIDTTTAAPNNRQLVKFKKSEPMPTYLVAYSVSSFVVYKKDNQRVQVWSRENAIDDCKYIQEQGERLLAAIENYLNVKYKLPKLDIVAVPDFAAGAMENYGLTTYRERYVHKNAIATERNIEFIVSVVAHEFSHQWFGDMVTPFWWDYLWLNEAFATFFEYRVPDMIQSDWKMSELFVVEQVQTAMMADLHDSHPITAKVNSPEEISDIFDRITYNKGGSILRMLEHFITPETFRSALSTYLDSTYNGAQGITDPGNFFEAVIDTMNTVTSQDWHDTMDKFKESWIDQAGHPVVTVIRDYTKKTATVSQRQFLFEEGETPSDKRWLIPLTFTTSSDKDFTLAEAKKRMVLFNPTEKTTSLDVQSARWLIVNIQEVGFYRVNYDDDNWKEIIATLWKEPFVIHRLNRVQLVDDTFNLARAGIISYSTPMTLSKYLVKETDPLPWLAAFPNFRFLLQRYQSHLLQPLKKHFAGLLKSKYDDSIAKARANDQKDHTEKASLITISQWACYLDIEACVQNAKTEMAKFVQNPEYKINPELREAVFCTGLRLGGDAEWDAVWNHYLKTDVATEKVLTLTTLPCSTQESALKFLVNELLTGENIRPQDNVYLIRSIAANSHQIHPALKLLKQNYTDFASGPKGEDVFRSMLSNVKHGVTTEDQLKELEFLLASNATQSHHTNMLKTTIAFIKKNFEWQEKHLAPLKKWLEDDQNPNNPTSPPNPPPGPTAKPTDKPSSATKPIATLISCSWFFLVLYRKFASFIL